MLPSQSVKSVSISSLVQFFSAAIPFLPFLDIFLAEHSSAGLGVGEDDESLFDNESSESWEEDAEKLTMFEFTATVVVFDTVSSGDNGDDAKCLVWGFQKLLSE